MAAKRRLKDSEPESYYPYGGPMHGLPTTALIVMRFAIAGVGAIRQIEQSYFTLNLLNTSGRLAVQILCRFPCISWCSFIHSPYEQKSTETARSLS